MTPKPPSPETTPAPTPAPTEAAKPWSKWWCPGCEKWIEATSAVFPPTHRCGDDPQAAPTKVEGEGEFEAWWSATIGMEWNSTAKGTARAAWSAARARVAALEAALAEEKAEVASLSDSIKTVWDPSVKQLGRERDLALAQLREATDGECARAVERDEALAKLREAEEARTYWETRANSLLAELAARSAGKDGGGR